MKIFKLGLAQLAHFVVVSFRGSLTILQSMTRSLLTHASNCIQLRKSSMYKFSIAFTVLVFSVLALFPINKADAANCTAQVTSVLRQESDGFHDKVDVTISDCGPRFSNLSVGSGAEPQRQAFTNVLDWQDQKYRQFEGSCPAGADCNNYLWEKILACNGKIDDLWGEKSGLGNGSFSLGDISTVQCTDYSINNLTWLYWGNYSIRTYSNFSADYLCEDGTTQRLSTPLAYANFCYEMPNRTGQDNYYNGGCVPSSSSTISLPVPCSSGDTITVTEITTPSSPPVPPLAPVFSCALNSASPSSSIDLSWKQFTNNDMSLYRGSTFLQKAGFSGTRLDPDLAPNTSYIYTLRNSTDDTQLAIATCTTKAALPGPPTVIASTPSCTAGAGKINLSFSQGPGGITTGYFLWRSPPNTPLSPSNAILSQQTSVIGDLVSPDSGLFPDHNYSYQLEARGPGGSRYSPISTATASVTCPPSFNPSDLTSSMTISGTKIPGSANDYIAGSTITLGGIVSNASGGSAVSSTFTNSYQYSNSLSGPYFGLNYDFPMFGIASGPSSGSVPPQDHTSGLSRDNFYFRLFADSGGAVSESNDTNNASAPVPANFYPDINTICTVSPNPITAGQSAVWSAGTPSGGYGTYAYSWSGSDSLTGGGQSVLKSYSTSGTKTASVIITSSGGSGGTITKFISCPNLTVNPAVVGAIGVNLTASLTSVKSGGSSFLTWTTSGSPNSCTASAAPSKAESETGWNSSKSTTGGSQSVNNITYDVTYIITCSKPGASNSPQTSSVTVSVIPPPGTPAITASTPSCAAGAGKINLSFGQGAGGITTDYYLYRSPPNTPLPGNAIQIQRTGFLNDLVSPDTGLTPGATYSYQLRASGPGGDRYSPIVTLTASVNCPPGAIGVNLDAFPRSVASGGSSFLTWTTSGNPDSCTASAVPFKSDWSGSKSKTGGSQTVSGITTDTTYTIVCSKPGASNSPQTSSVLVSVTPPPAGVTLTVSTPSCAAGAGKINFSAGQAFGGGVTNGYYLWRSPANTPLSPSNAILAQSVGFLADLVSPDSGLVPGASYSYQLEARGPGGSRFSSIVTATASVACPPGAIGVDLKVTPGFPSSVISGGSSNLTWTTSGNPDSCTASASPSSGSWSGLKSTTGGSGTVSNITTSTTYTIVCGKSGTSNVSSSVNITVTASPVPPGTPTVTATTPSCAAGAGKINLSFSQGSGGPTNGYYLWRSPANTPLSPSNAILAQQETLIQDLVSPDSGLFPDHNYSYQLEARGPSASRYSPIVTATASVACPPPVGVFNYSLTNSGDISLTPGSSNSNVITATLESGAAQSVSLTIPSATLATLSSGGVTPSWTGGNTVTPTNTKTLTFTAAPGAVSRTYNIIVSGVSPVRSTSFNVTVSPETKPSVIALKSNSLCGVINLTQYRGVAGASNYQLQSSFSSAFSGFTNIPNANKADISQLPSTDTPTVPAGTTVYYRVVAVMSDGSPNKTSDASFAKPSACPSTYEVQLQVQDSNGGWSDSASIPSNTKAKLRWKVIQNP